MSDDGIIVRRAESQDRSALLDLQAKSFRIHGRHHYGIEVIEAFLAHVGTLDPALLEDRTYFVIEGEGVILACGGWSVRRPRYATHAAANDADPGLAVPKVRAVYAHPLMARQGLGRRIMHRIEIEIANAGYERATLTSTLTGLPLYRALGYQGDAPVILNLPGGHPFVGIAMEKRLVAQGSRRAA